MRRWVLLTSLLLACSGAESGAAAGGAGAAAGGSGGTGGVGAAGRGGAGAAGTAGTAGAAGTGGGGAGASGGGAAGSAGSAGAAGNPISPIVRLHITPENMELLHDGRTPATVQFRVMAVHQDGTETPAQGPFWMIQDSRLGSLDPGTGAFASTLDRGGRTQIAVEASAMRADTMLSVRMEKTVLGPGVPADVPGRFQVPDATDPARRPALVYPEDGTMLPRNLRPIDVQWEAPGRMGDVYELSFMGPRASIRYWLLHDAGFKLDHLVSAADWRTIAESNAGQRVTLHLRRLDSVAGDVLAAPDVQLTFADTDFRGVIYYWALNLGKIVRLRPDSAAPEDFMTPPPNPAATNPDHGRCVACHTISRDGRKLAFEYWGGNEWTGVVDLLNAGSPMLMPNIARGNFQTWGPDGTRLLVNFNKGLSLLDAATGAPIANTGLPASRAAHPIWAPDGSAVAYAANVMRSPGVEAQWEIDFGASDLAIVPSMAGDRFGPPQILVPGAGRANFYPTYDPTSSVIVYNRSDWSRSDNGPVVQPSTGELWSIPARGGTPVELRKANTGGRSWLPTFSPFSGGGVHWLAFFSRRNYGNALAGTKGTGRRQIWVAAVDQNAPLGADPSHAGFWLPAQVMTTENMSAYWAPEACIIDGQTGCSSDVECCGGVCAPGPMGGTCGSPPPQCRPRGSSCQTSAQCCDGTQCIQSFCGTIG